MKRFGMTISLLLSLMVLTLSTAFAFDWPRYVLRPQTNPDDVYPTCRWVPNPTPQNPELLEYQVDPGICPAGTARYQARWQHEAPYCNTPVHMKTADWCLTPDQTLALTPKLNEVSNNGVKGTVWGISGAGNWIELRSPDGKELWQVTQANELGIWSFSFIPQATYLLRNPAHNLNKSVIVEPLVGPINLHP